jgi:26S proteasome regulatory subunit N1
MAGDSETSKPADKGKGKAVDDPKKEKPLVNGKKDEDKIIDCGLLLSRVACCFC